GGGRVVAVRGRGAAGRGAGRARGEREREGGGEGEEAVGTAGSGTSRGHGWASPGSGAPAARTGTPPRRCVLDAGRLGGRDRRVISRRTDPRHRSGAAPTGQCAARDPSTSLVRRAAQAGGARSRGADVPASGTRGADRAREVAQWRS